MEMLLKSHIQCECEKKTLLFYMLYTVRMLASTKAQIMILHLKKCSHLVTTLSIRFSDFAVYTNKKGDNHCFPQ